MAEKCEICKKRITVTFLKKIVGSIFKDEDGKKHNVCALCQRTLKNDKKKILETIKEV